MKRMERVWGGVVVTVTLCALAPASANAAATAKAYSVTLSPTTVVSGQRTTIAATITNNTLSSVGSANFTPPAGFSVVSASVPGGNATVSATTAQLRNMNITKGQSKVASLVVDPRCTPVTNAPWAAVAKSPADFKGSALAPAPSLATSTTGTCTIAFTTNPTDAQTLTPITGTAGDPSGPPVAVSLLDGSGFAAAGTAVSVKLGTAPSGAVLDGTTSQDTSGGGASFGNLTVSKPGKYTLVASSGGSAVTSDAFRADQGVTACMVGIFCAASATTTGPIPGTHPPETYTNTVTVDVADGGDEPLHVSYNVGPDIACPGYTAASPDREVFFGPNGAKEIFSRIDGRLLAAVGRAPATLRTCLVAPYDFGGATPIGDIDGDGNPDFRGVLDDCSDTDGVAPCQVGVFIAGSEFPVPFPDAIVDYRLPASDLDPIARH